MATRGKSGAGTRRSGTKRRAAVAAPKFEDIQRQMLPASRGSSTGSLIVIGGREDKNGDKHILREVCAHVGGSKLVIATIATAHPDEVWEEYRQLFRGLGVTSLAHLHIESRGDAFSADKLSTLVGAKAVFFTGGDQLRITSRIGGAPVCDSIRTIFQNGGVIAGTSAGASAVSETMLVSAPGEVSHTVDSLQTAPGRSIRPDHPAPIQCTAKLTATAFSAGSSCRSSPSPASSAREARRIRSDGSRGGGHAVVS